MEEVANAGCLVSATLGAVATAIPAPSLTSKAGILGILTGTLDVALIGGISGTCTGKAGTGTIEYTAEKIKVDGEFVLRKGDTGTGTVNGTDSATSGGHCTFDVDLEIIDAGQTKVLAN